MKTLFSVLLFVALPMITFAQNKAIDDIFAKFEGKPGITSLRLTKDMMNLAAQVDSGNGKTAAVFAQIEGIRVLALEKATNEDKATFDAMIDKLQLSNYKELMVVQDKGNRVRMLSKENQGKITEFLLLVSGQNDPVLVSITGSINPADLGKLSGAGMNGFKYLAQLHHTK